MKWCYPKNSNELISSPKFLVMSIFFSLITQSNVKWLHMNQFSVILYESSMALFIDHYGKYVADILSFMVNGYLVTSFCRVQARLYFFTCF